MVMWQLYHIVLEHYIPHVRHGCQCLENNTKIMLKIVFSREKMIYKGRDQSNEYVF